VPATPQVRAQAEEDIAALLTEHNIDEAAKVVGVSPNTRLN
jgi:hypothetical protein